LIQEGARFSPGSRKLLLRFRFGRKAEAESYFALGLIERGEKAFQAMVEEFPDSAWAYIGWGDMYWFFRDSKALRDYEKTEKIYHLALERNVTGRDDVSERLKDLEEERNRKGANA